MRSATARYFATLGAIDARSQEIPVSRFAPRSCAIGKTTDPTFNAGMVQFIVLTITLEMRRAQPRSTPGAELEAASWANARLQGLRPICPTGASFVAVVGGKRVTIPNSVAPPQVLGFLSTNAGRACARRCCGPMWGAARAARPGAGAPRRVKRAFA